jgi:hypothetical protein
MVVGISVLVIAQVPDNTHPHKEPQYSNHLCEYAPLGQEQHPSALLSLTVYAAPLPRHHNRTRPWEVLHYQLDDEYQHYVAHDYVCEGRQRLKELVQVILIKQGLQVTWVGCHYHAVCREDAHTT